MQGPQKGRGTGIDDNRGSHFKIANTNEPISQSTAIALASCWRYGLDILDGRPECRPNLPYSNSRFSHIFIRPFEDPHGKPLTHFENYLCACHNSTVPLCTSVDSSHLISLYLCIVFCLLRVLSFFPWSTLSSLHSSSNLVNLLITLIHLQLPRLTSCSAKLGLCLRCAL